MSTASVLIPAPRIPVPRIPVPRIPVPRIPAPRSPAPLIPAAEAAAGTAGPTPRYSLLLSRDPELIDAAQRLRHRVFSTEPGFAPPAAADGRDADEFDEHCDHLLVRDDGSDEIVGCYRMLPPPGAIAAGGLYSATEFDLRAWDPLRPSLVEMGRAVVRADHRNGAVVLLMWTGILAYLDRSGYDLVAGCVSVPIHGEGAPGGQVRGVRDFVARRHAAPAELTVVPHRPVRLDGRGLDDLPAPARPTIPPLMRGYLRLGAQVCGEPAHDPEFGVADFPALLDKRRADVRYLNRLRSAGSAAPASR
ncbi:MAG TPA: GNAT family N-acyltransferase [Mycobacterium sp.]|nr:GNAT family N-acyltransferase [Mycobacterium sp.]